MSKKLAIKGHPTRGKEIIELLEMMGGHKDTLLGDDAADINYFYFILTEEKNVIDGYPLTYKEEVDKDYMIFSLEEFLEKYPFKVGDKVFLYDNITEGCVTGMKWDKNKGAVKYCVYTSAEYWCDAKDIKKYNTALEPEEIESSAIKLVDGKVVDGLEKIHKLGPKSKLSPQYYEDNKNEFEEADTPKAPILSNREDYAEGKFGYVIPNGYEFDSIRNNQIIIRPIKSKYPKTYKECCEVLSLPLYYNLTYYTYERGYTEFTNNTKLCLLEDKLNTLGKVIICRDAYWKIAGEQMGLGKPWEPDWDNLSTNHEFIKIDKGCFTYSSRELVFPTKEVCDAFYENFKELIEKCKELL